MSLFALRSARWIALAAVVTGTSAQAQDGIFGIWTEPTGSSIEVLHCDADICLRLVAVSPNAPTQTDDRNPDPALRHRALCGLLIGRGFHLEHGVSKAEGGWLYDPKSGKTYHGSLARVGETLSLRGYVGLKIFGATETWQRAQSTPPPCSKR